MPNFRKITVFECPGTAHLFADDSLPEPRSDTFTKLGVDLDLFNHVWVTDYPNALWPGKLSHDAGVNSVLAKVRSTPGRFVLVGYSQGASIMTDVYRSVKGTSRESDCVGVFLMANPLREAGRAFPGAAQIAPGHGIAPENVRFVNTPSLVWEFANPGDPVCTLGDTAQENIWADLYAFLRNEFAGPITEITSNLKEVLKFFTSLPAHGVYPTGLWKPPGETRTIKDIILTQLNTVVGPANAASYPITYGLTTSANVARPARAAVARWNDKINRHTLYTVCGTGSDGWGLYNDPGVEPVRQQQLEQARAVSGNGTYTMPADGEPLPDWAVSFDAAVGRTLGATAKFNWVPISYPAAAWGLTPVSLENNWNPPDMSIADSVAVGVAELVSQIKATPGTFALSGHSQGAAVISQVLRAMMPGGSLADRYKDCIGAVAFGNPCRKPGPGYAGMADPGGGGMLAYLTSVPSLMGLASVTLPSWWMELATPGDIFACAPVTGPAKDVITALASSMSAAKGQDNRAGTVVSLLGSAFLGAGAPVLGAVLQSASSAVFRPNNETPLSVIRSWLTAQKGFGLANPHILYGKAKPSKLPTGVPGLTGASTYVDVAVAYLTARGNAVAPR